MRDNFKDPDPGAGLRDPGQNCPGEAILHIFGPQTGVSSPETTGAERLWAPMCRKFFANVSQMCRKCVGDVSEMRRKCVVPQMCGALFSGAGSWKAAPVPGQGRPAVGWAPRPGFLQPSRMNPLSTLHGPAPYQRHVAEEARVAEERSGKPTAFDERA